MHLKVFIIAFLGVNIALMSCRSQKKTHDDDNNPETSNTDPSTDTTVNSQHGGSDIMAQDTESSLSSDDNVPENTESQNNLDRPTDHEDDTAEDQDHPIVNPDRDETSTIHDEEAPLDETVEVPDECQIVTVSVDDTIEGICNVGMNCGDDPSLIGVGCVVTAEEALRCHCDTILSNMEFTISGLSLAEGCAYMAEICLAGEIPEPEEEPECIPKYRTDEDLGCEFEETCDYEIATTEGRTLDLTKDRSVNCEIDEAGVWACECNTEAGYLTMSFESSQEAETLCNDTMNMCRNAHSLSPIGDIGCRTAFQSAGDDACDSQIICKQEGTLDEISVELSGWTWSYCQRKSSGSPEWGCKCTIGSDVTSYTLTETDPDPFVTCSQAAKQCGEIVHEQGKIVGLDPTYYGDFF